MKKDQFPKIMKLMTVEIESVKLFILRKPRVMPQLLNSRNFQGDNGNGCRWKKPRGSSGRRQRVGRVKIPRW